MQVFVVERPIDLFVDGWEAATVVTLYNSQSRKETPNTTSVHGTYPKRCRDLSLKL